MGICSIVMELFGWWLVTIWLLLGLRVATRTRKSKRQHYNRTQVLQSSIESSFSALNSKTHRGGAFRGLVAWASQLTVDQDEHDNQLRLILSFARKPTANSTHSRLIQFVKVVLHRDRNMLLRAAKFALGGMLLWSFGNAVLLFARTGSWHENPYEWYSTQATGERLFSREMPLPSTILHTCRLGEQAWSNTSNNIFTTTMNRFVAPMTFNATSIRQRKTVYVVPHDTTGVVSIQEEHLVVTNVVVDGLHTSIATTTDSDSSPTKSFKYQIIRPVENLTFFAYLWHFLLVDKASTTSFKALPSQETMSLRRVFDAINLDFVVVQNQNQLEALPPNSSVVVVAQSLNAVAQLVTKRSDLKVGFLALAREDCNNPDVHVLYQSPQVKFGMIPYGDCALVDHERFHVVALGPKFEHGFPLNLDALWTQNHQQEQPPRTHLLNLMVSYTTEKPTRMQALMAASQLCQSHRRYRCILEQNDWLFKSLEQIDDVLHLNLRMGSPSSLTVASSFLNLEYVRKLQKSIFTLCPLGKNPEQYRIWESLAAGSIPIIEDLQLTPGTFWHPSYPGTWKCLPQYVHSILKRFNAPVLFVNDWRTDLPELIDYFVMQHPDELERLQLRTVVWYREYFDHLQALLVHHVIEMVA